MVFLGSPLKLMITLKFMMNYSPRKRVIIVALRKHADFSIRQIPDNLSQAKSTVGRVLKRADDIGVCVALRPVRCGRNLKPTPHVDKKLCEGSQENQQRSTERFGFRWRIW